jgi:transcriptional regulator with XRE-family HTH domain
MNHHNTKGVSMLRIKLLRISLTLSQWEVSRASGMSQGRYSMIERGLIVPTAEERERLAHILHAAAATLFRPACRVRHTAAAPVCAE